MNKRFLLLTLILGLMLLPLTVAAQTHDGTLGAAASHKAPGDTVFAFDVGTAVTDTQCLGVEWVSPYLYVTGGATATDPNKLYVLDTTGTLVGTYDQTSAAGWGWRDMAYDGSYLYASDDATIEYFDFTAVVAGTINGPDNPNRALAYDPDTDHFWTGNFSNNIQEFDRTGAVINTFAQANSVYGMAWDNLSEDGPWLWVTDQNTQTILQFDPVAGTFTGVSYAIPLTGTYGTAGGLTVGIWSTVDADVPVLIVLNQEEPSDYIYGIELDACGSGCLKNSGSIFGMLIMIILSWRSIRSSLRNVL